MYNQANNQDLPIIPVILCGGAGSRLWPLSRTNTPKQCLPLMHQLYTMLQQTVQRIADLNYPELIIITNQDHHFIITEQLSALGVNATIILEPEGRNTAAAICAANLYICDNYDDALMLVLPSDHFIQDVAAFLEAVEKAKHTAQHGYLVTFGITPSHAEVGYGYIKQSEKIGMSDAYILKEFVEKPNLERAQQYFESGEYLWNSGMFMFPATRFHGELEKFQPLILQSVKDSITKAQRENDAIKLEADSFIKSPSIPIDIAVMEKTANAAVIPLSCGWNDVGSWDALWNVQDKDSDGNVARGMVIRENSHNNYFYAMDNAPAISSIGVDGLVVISTSDIITVTSMSSAQDVKKLLEKAQEIEPKWKHHHTQVMSPWGKYETLYQPSPVSGADFEVKYINLNSKESINAQSGDYLIHLIATSGEATITINNETTQLQCGEHILIPKGANYIIENEGDATISLLSLQMNDDEII
jgi:mannose-1-phosphate guanylyltransferase/mannose-6-phosphate isomerase